jgi:hypothetical protein
MLNSMGEIVEWLGTAKDVTAAKLAQEQSFARQILESLGTLASGIAHDFNNLLGSVLPKRSRRGRNSAVQGDLLTIFCTGLGLVSGVNSGEASPARTALISANCDILSGYVPNLITACGVSHLV